MYIHQAHSLQIDKSLLRALQQAKFQGTKVFIYLVNQKYMYDMPIMQADLAFWLFRLLSSYSVLKTMYKLLCPHSFQVDS